MPVRRINRTTALAALREAAEALQIAPEDLTITEYRHYRATRPEPTGLPSHMAIAVVLGGWWRACELAGARTVTTTPRAAPSAAKVGPAGT